MFGGRESMLRTIRTNFDRHETRRDRRYPLPPIAVIFGAEEYMTANWSLGGFLIEARGAPAPGSTVAGSIRIPDGKQLYPFSAEVVRRDGDGIGFRFVQPSGELIGALDRLVIGRMRRART